MSFVSACSPDRPALFLESGRQVSFAELDAEVSRFRHAIPQRGVMFCLCNNDLPSLRAYLAGLEGAAVPLLLPGGIHETQLAALIAAYSPAYLFHQRSDLHLPGYEQVLWEEDGYRLLARTPQADLPLHPDLALLLATSGSTGSPKLVRLSRQNLEANADAIIDYLGINTGERAITSLPMHYSYGLSVINSHLRAGATVVLTDRSLMDAEFWRLIQRNEVTSFAGVPYTYEMLLKLRIERLNMPAMKTMTQAGGKLAADKIKLVAEACAKKDIRFFTMYGQTEATARIAYLPSEATLAKAGAIGIAIPGGRLWIEDEQGQTIHQAGTTGQLVYAGPNVCLGYATSSSDLAEGDVNGGVLRTGDLACFDADGHFSITGRLSRFIKLYGIRVSLDAVEKMLAEQGWQSAAWGDDDHLRICLLGSHSADTEAIRHTLAETLGVNKAGVSVMQREALPRLANGKIDYPALAGAA